MPAGRLPLTLCCAGSNQSTKLHLLSLQGAACACQPALSALKQFESVPDLAGLIKLVLQSGKELVLGGIKPPKAKEWDADKTYMQRPVGEQFRPPPPKGPQTKQGAARQ